MNANQKAHIRNANQKLGEALSLYKNVALQLQEELEELSEDDAEGDKGRDLQQILDNLDSTVGALEDAVEGGTSILP
jgi:hypothetical protein